LTKKYKHSCGLYAVFHSERCQTPGALQDISHMPARVKCAVLGWHTMEELLKEEK
jgi:NifU-like protein involved in Fe-S cluster formation